MEAFVSLWKRCISLVRGGRVVGVLIIDIFQCLPRDCEGSVILSNPLRSVINHF